MTPAVPWVAALPAGAEAHDPPEARGLRRDEVRLMVSLPGGETAHGRFTDLTAHLRRGDLLVINTSGTLPAAVDARAAGHGPLRLHFSSRLPGDTWLVEPRVPAGPASTPYRGDLEDTTLALAGGATARLWRHFPGSTRLWLATLDLPDTVPAYLRRRGQPIRYPYIDRPWPIEDYQTVYATEAGSAEMPSAGRPFSPRLIVELVASGVGIAPVLLHTGVSSLEGEEEPYPEWFAVPADTAARVNQARDAGGRVIAVGTTVVRALESTADGGRVSGGSGWTDLVVTPERGAATVDGLLTGLHDPRASHLAMLEAVAPAPVLERAYIEAVERGYLWHEFGDSHLVLRR